MNLKRLLLVSFIASFFVLVFVPQLKGQLGAANNPTPAETIAHIKVSIPTNSTIQFKVKSSSGALNCWVELWEGGMLSFPMGTEWTDVVFDSKSSTSVKLSGQITGLHCVGNFVDMTSIDASGNPHLVQLLCQGKNVNTLNLNNCVALEELDCSYNRLTSLDLSACSKIKKISVQNNLFDSQTYNQLYCSLPIREESDHAYLYAASIAGDATLAFKDSNANIAGGKGWNVCAASDNTPLNTYGFVTCDQLTPPNGLPMVTFHVKENAIIGLDLNPKILNDLVWLEIAPDEFVHVKTAYEWSGRQGFEVKGTTLKVYGDLYGLNCDNNGEDITGVDASKCPDLSVLSCSNCQILSLDLSQNTKLRTLFCEKNRLTSLDLTHNPEINWVDCYNNQLKNIKIGTENKLIHLSCYGNLFIASVLDAVYCKLNSYQPDESIVIIPAYSNSDENHNQILESNATIARDKGFKVVYGSGGDVPTVGRFFCDSSTPVEENQTASLNLFPNPAKDYVYINGLENPAAVEMFNLSGIRILSYTVNPGEPLFFNGVPSGIYVLRINGKVLKLHIN